MWVFFQFVYLVGYTNRFSYVDPPLHLWDKADLIMVDDFSEVFLDSVVSILLSIFASMFMNETGL